MKNLNILFLLFALTLFSCTKDDIKPETEQEVQFTFGENTGPNARTAASYTLDDAKTALLTIETSEGGSTAYENHELPLLRINGALLTEKISLSTGDYQLTGFFLLDSAGNVLYTVPQEGSPLAPHVIDPLPVAFSVSANQAQTVGLEVIRTETYTPTDFGLISFQLTEVPVVDFLLSVSEAATNNLLSGTIQFTNGEYSFTTTYDSITNNVIRIREYEGDYTLTVSAEGYQDQTLTLTANQLKTLYHEQPLVVELVQQTVQIIGSIQTVAGTGHGGYNGNGISATEAELYYAQDIAFDSQGNFYISDVSNSKIRKVDTSGIITSLDINPYNITPIALTIDNTGNNIFIAGRLNGVATNDDGILKVNLESGETTLVAGGNGRGSGGDGGWAVDAQLHSPRGVAVDPFGNLYISETFGNRIRKVDAETGVITTIAGTGEAGYNGDNIWATEARIKLPYMIEVGLDGNIYIPDSYNNRIRKIDSETGIITTVAGTGTMGYTGDGGLAVNADLNIPNGICFDQHGNLYFSSSNHVIRRISPDGIISTVAGTGSEGYSGDGGIATEAQLYLPMGITIGPDGNLFLADYQNHRIRKIILN